MDTKTLVVGQDICLVCDSNLTMSTVVKIGSNGLEVGGFVFRHSADSGRNWGAFGTYDWGGYIQAYLADISSAECEALSENQFEGSSLFWEVGNLVLNRPPTQISVFHTFIELLETDNAIVGAFSLRDIFPMGGGGGHLIIGNNLIEVTDEQLLGKLRSINGQYFYGVFPVFYYDLIQGQPYKGGPTYHGSWLPGNERGRRFLKWGEDRRKFLTHAEIQEFIKEEGCEKNHLPAIERN